MYYGSGTVHRIASGLHMLSRVRGRRCTCTDQMAALVSVKWRHGHHLESVTSNWKSDSVNWCVFTWRTFQSDLKWHSLRLFEQRHPKNKKSSRSKNWYASAKTTLNLVTLTAVGNSLCCSGQCSQSDVCKGWLAGKARFEPGQTSKLTAKWTRLEHDRGGSMQGEPFWPAL